MSPEWIYLTITSNWAHEVTSDDSSTCKENIGDAYIWFITWSFTSSGISERHLWIVSLERDVCLIFASLASPRNSFTVFNKQDFTSISLIVWIFLRLAISSMTSYDACVLGENFRQDVSDISNLLHGVGRILNLFWREMPYHLRRFHSHNMESLYITAIRFFLNVDCKYTTINYW